MTTEKVEVSEGRVSEGRVLAGEDFLASGVTGDSVSERPVGEDSWTSEIPEDGESAGHGDSLPSEAKTTLPPLE